MRESKWTEAGEVLRELRKPTGKSIYKVARAIHISGNYLSQLERGQAAPSDIVLMNIADYYNVERAKLFSLYNRIEPNVSSAMIENESIRNLFTKISIDPRLSESERENLIKQIDKLYDNYTKGK